MPEPQKCSASSKQTGKPCRQFAIAGGTVCRYHGGAAPQVKAAAQRRLATLVDPAIAVLAASMRQRKDARLRLTAAQDVLDRNNMSGKQLIDVTSGGQTWADVLRERRAKRAVVDAAPLSIAAPDVPRET